MTDDKIDAPSDAPTQKSDASSDAAPTTENKGTEESPPKPCTPDDLIELIRAIKFSHTDMSIRNVHNEISVTMANSDKSYAFLSEVKLNDVKKVWKKALKGSSTNDNNGSSSQNITNATNTSKQTGEPPPIVPTEGVIKFYTVGDGSVKALAENYTNHHAKVAIEESQQQNDTIEKEKGKYTHFFLDVPADLSGSRPHQALINYQENHKSSGKGKGKKNKKSAASNNNEGGREVFKIQLPALPPGMEDTPTVLLLYNANRSAKTFVHPPEADDKDDDGGYAKIRKMIIDSGISGALGTTGGSKAYFYGFITKTKSGPNVVSIDIDSGVVKDQTW